MRLSPDIVRRFAEWSADRNPLHTDETYARSTHFGRPVAHGVLTVLEAFRTAGSPSASGGAAPARVRALDIEFRSALGIGDDCEVESHADGTDLVLTVSREGQPALHVRAEMRSPGVVTEPMPMPSDGLQPASAVARDAENRTGLRSAPAGRTVAELERGVEVAGTYGVAAPPGGWAHAGPLTPTHATVLALCSYITGMELPGLRSLFTRITIEFHADAGSAPELRYRARTVRFDRQFRMLETALEAIAADGRLVASGRLHSYVPFSPVRTDLDDLAAALAPDAHSLRGKVALVVGGSRGFGADLAASLAISGCHVFASARQDDEARRSLFEAIAERQGRIAFLEGDAGDPAWCASALEAIRARHGRLDLLVLNACAPPVVLRLGTGSAAAHARYVEENLRLVETPLAAFAGALDESGGAVVCVSSSYVDEPPPGFGAYVAVKHAAEGLTRTVVRERPRMCALIARPPALQTRWNDTPAGVLGTIPSSRAAVHVVNRLASSWRPGEIGVLTEFPPLVAWGDPGDRGRPRIDSGVRGRPQGHEGQSPRPEPSLRIRVAATFTIDPLLPLLESWSGELDLDAAVDAAPYGQVLQSLLDPSSLLHRKDRGVNVVLVRVGDWLRELPDEQAGDSAFVGAHLGELVRDLERAVRTHRAQAASETLLVICPSTGAASPPADTPLREAEISLVQSLAGIPGLQVLSAGDYHDAYAVAEDRIHDPLRDDIAHIPYRDEYLQVLATIVARRLYRRLAPVRKVVVTDCDNTLWRGVVGEVGAEGVEIDEGHRTLHRMLVRLAQSGVLVCLCSKNEEADVWQVFETRSDLLLRREHVVAAAINWLPKSQNIRALAARLNLGIDSFVFLDDNPVECAEVRTGCPEVLTIEWPHDPDRMQRLAQHIWELDIVGATKEDERRTELYRQELRRQELRAGTLTFEEFLENLQLEVDCSPLVPADLKRAAQLTLRTNQFNFTTIRREESDIQALASGGKHEIRTVRVRDRFGDYGLVGLVIAERGEEAWSLDTFLLSCRVLGRGVEHRILADLGRMAADAGAARVRLRLETTKRNTPARAFLDAVVPAELRRADERGVTCDLPSDTLAAVRFEPSAAGDVVVEDEGSAKTSSQAVDTSHLRRREAQIARAAEGDAVQASRSRAAHTEADRPAGGHDHGPEQSRREASGGVFPEGLDAGEAGIARIVHDAFASALRVPRERVAEVDRLEALGCSSLRIVEITVALSERFPTMPGTLLFEHQTVSEIVREIARLAGSGGDSRATGDEAPRFASSEDSPPVAARDIAVVGMHVRCAGAGSPDELWEMLRTGRSAVGPVPPDRRHFLRPLDDARPHWAGLLEEVSRFDAELFGVSPREAAFMDPQLRLFLEVAWSALEDAGCAGEDRHPDTGVFAGVMYGDYGGPANLVAKEAGTAYRCWEGFSLANRLSQLLGFHGPSLSVDTACSSSGTALHLACTALRAGECPVAVVGGVNLILDPDRFGSLGRLGILSTRGRCEPFGADADGTVLGEGAAVVVLRPLDDAIRRGDRIYGVIKGTGLSTGSGTVGFTAPNPQAQAEAIRRGLRAAGVDPRTVSYVETHGTGTALGDPIEVRGLTLGYGAGELRDPEIALEHRCTIGSIKPNVGHLEAGAGVVALIKVLLQLQHRTLVPSLTSPEPNRQIPFSDGPFAVQRVEAAWDAPVLRRNGESIVLPRRAGISSFGVGGANVHMVVEEAPQPPASAAPTVDRPRHLLALSGPHEEALRLQADRLQRYLASAGEAWIGDICFSLNTGRRHFPHRAGVTAASRDELQAALRDLAAGRAPLSGRPVMRSKPKVAFLFTGQGSQYAGMGKALYDTQPVFREAIDRAAATLDTLLPDPLLDVLFAGEPAESTHDEETEEQRSAARLHQTGYTQPALFAVEYALARLWQSWGVQPDVVLGHSVGEIAAMCVAGGLELEDGLRLVAARGSGMQALPPGGVMTSVNAPEARVLDAIAGFEHVVSIAAINAPAQVVIAGAAAAVAEVTDRLTAGGIRTKPLVVSHAFHSPLMTPMLAEYERIVRGIRFQTPRIPVVSTVTPRADAVIRGDEAAGADMTRPEYWLRQVMAPVRFADAMRALESAGAADVFIEIGPHPVLIGAGRQSVSDEDAFEWLPSLRRDAGAWDTLLDSVARLYACGETIDWKAFDAPYGRKRISVPTYAFADTEYWLPREIPNQTVVGAASPGLSSAEGRRPDAHAVVGAATRQPNTQAVVGAAFRRPNAAPPAVYDLVWQTSDVAAEDSSSIRHDHWIVLADRGGLGVELAIGLHAAGVAVTLVTPGAAFQSDGPGRFRVNPDRPDDLDRLLATVIAEGAKAPGVAHLWSLDAAQADAPTAADLLEAGRAGVSSVLHLVQAAARAGLRQRAVWIVTRGAAGPGGDAAQEAHVLAQAPVWGFGRTVALEHPELWGGLIDASHPDVRSAARALARELTSGSVEDQVALSASGRYVARLVPADTLAKPPNAGAPALRTRVRSDRTYLITGGLGALGLRTARWLADQGARHLVLAGRRSVVDEPVRAAIDSIERTGARVTVVQADVSQPAEVDTLLARAAAAGPPLTGIVHAAGVDAPMPIDTMTAADVEAALAAKMTGGWLLHDRTRGLELDLFVCFSSVASVLGAQGRAHYGAANAFLDALAALRRRQGLAATAVGWGPWAGGGMATPEHLEQFERIGNHPLDPDAALQVLGSLTAAPLGHAIVAGIDWERFRPAYEARRERPILAALAVRHSSPEDEQDPIEIFYPEDPRREIEGEAGSLHGDSRRSPAQTAGAAPWIEQLRPLPAVEREPALAALLRAEVADTLGFDRVDRVPLDRSFYEMGMDSLMMADLVSRLRQRVGMSCSGLIFDHPDVSSLSVRLLERLSLDQAPAAAAAGAHHRVRLEPDVVAVGSMSAVTSESAPRRLEAHPDTRFTEGEPALDPSHGRQAPQRDSSIGGYDASVEEEVFAFQAAAWPRRSPDLIPSRWRWMFVDSARRLGMPPRVWLHREAGIVVGHMGAIPVRLKIGDDERDTAWLVDTMVLEPYRDRAIGSRLMVEAREDQPFALSLGQTAEMREIQFRLGWKQVGPMLTAYLPVRPEVVLQGKLPAPAAWAAGMGLRASSAVRGLWRQRNSLDVREVARFDERHDRLWREVQRDLTCAVVRDASYLNWKYVEQPGQRFLRVEVLEDGDLRGVAVWMVREPSRRYHYRRAYLVDFVAPLADAARLERVLQAVCSHAAEASGVDALGCYHMHPRLTAALRACGFHLREPRRFLLVDPGPLCGPALDMVLSPDNWYVTHGDSDIERPW